MNENNNVLLRSSSNLGLGIVVKVWVRFKIEK
jgi:hypothetical protein